MKYCNKCMVPCGIEERYRIRLKKMNIICPCVSCLVKAVCTQMCVPIRNYLLAVTTYKEEFK